MSDGTLTATGYLSSLRNARLRRIIGECDAAIASTLETQARLQDARREAQSLLDAADEREVAPEPGYASVAIVDLRTLGVGASTYELNALDPAMRAYAASVRRWVDRVIDESEERTAAVECGGVN